MARRHSFHTSNRVYSHENRLARGLKLKSEVLNVYCLSAHVSVHITNTMSNIPHYSHNGLRASRRRSITETSRNVSFFGIRSTAPMMSSIYNILIVSGRCRSKHVAGDGRIMLLSSYLTAKSAEGLRFREVERISYISITDYYYN